MNVEFRRGTEPNPMPLARHPQLVAIALTFVVAVVASLAACGADDTGPALTTAAAEGRSIARSNGCAACHGRNGEGGPGPAFVGLFGSTVELDDASTVAADVDYLIESIRDPGAKTVAGYGIVMPTNDLSDAEIAAVIAWIEALADADAGAGS